MINLQKIKNRGTFNILVVDRARISSLIKNYCAIKILESKKKTNCIVISDLRKDHYLYKLYKKMGFEKIEKTLSLNIIFYNFFILIKSVFKFSTIFKYFINNDFHKFIYNYKVSNITIGDIVYDRYIRTGFNFLSPSFLDIKFLKIFFYTIFKTYYIEKLIKKKKIDLIIVNTHVYANNYSISFKLSKKLKIDLLYIKDFQITYFKKGKYSMKNDPRVITKDKLNTNYLTKIKKNYMKKILKKRIYGKLKHFDFKFAYSNNKKIIKNDLKKLNIDINKFEKVVLLAPHALSDANHFYQEFGSFSPFKDYYTQLIETLRFAKENPQILFLVRPHPSSSFWKENGLIEKILKKYTRTNILLVDRNYSTSDLLENSDTVITVSGTIGLEAAGYFRKKPILAGKSIYSSAGFSFNSMSKREYFNNILMPKKKFILNNIEYNFALKALYYHQEVLNKEFPTVISMENRLLSTNKYIVNLNKFLKKKNIEQDPYYKYLEEKINL